MAKKEPANQKEPAAVNVKVRVLAPNFIKYGSKAGDELTIPEAQAERLVSQGRAEYVSKARQAQAEGEDAASGSKGAATSPTPASDAGRA